MCVTWSFFRFLSPPPFSGLLPADTKRKVEQISEELRSLDEMLAGNEGADGAVEVTADEASPAPSDEPDQPDRKGAFLFLRGKRPLKYFSNLSKHSIQIYTVVFISITPDAADVSQDAGSEEAEDLDFWDGVTKPGNSKTTVTQQEQVFLMNHAYLQSMHCWWTNSWFPRLSVLFQPNKLFLMIHF